MTLAEAFGTQLPAPMAGNEVDADLETRLASLVARGRAAYPDLALDSIAFVRHLGQCVALLPAEGAPALEALAIEDLYLASSCLAGVAGAAEAFEARCDARLRAVLSTTVRSSDLRAEVRQSVLGAVLVGTAESPPKIASYLGQAPIDRWVAVVAQRHVVSIMRHDGSEQRARERAGVEAAMTGAIAPELLFAKQRYRSEFENALTGALSVLPEEDRLLLRLQLVSGLSLESIAKMYGIGKATTARRLARAREAVAGEVTRLLRERIQISPDEIASLAGVVASQIDVSMSRLLKPPL